MNSTSIATNKKVNTKHVLDKLTRQFDINKFELNLFTFNDDFEFKRVNRIPGLDIIKTPGFTNVFATHESNKFLSCKLIMSTYDNVGLIMKSPYSMRSLIMDFGSKSKLFIDEDFSCGGVEIKLREHWDVYIGKDCMFSSGISMWTSDGHAIFDETGKLINIGGDIIIGDHVWVGHGVKFLKKTFVNDGSVVGGSSLVNKKFNEQNVILAGFPAKVIRKNISWTRKPVFAFTDKEHS